MLKESSSEKLILFYLKEYDSYDENHFQNIFLNNILSLNPISVQI